MRTLRFDELDISIDDLPVLEHRARELAHPELVETERREGSYVGFQVRGIPCALGSELVARVVSRLGAVVPVSGTPASVAGVTFVDNSPFLVLDLLRALGEPRPLAALADAPALLLREPSGTVAIAVEGPLELLDAVKLLPSTSGAGPGQLPLLGRLVDGPFVLDDAWLRPWAQTLGAHGG